jgi:hypothetical protein
MPVAREAGAGAMVNTETSSSVLERHQLSLATATVFVGTSRQRPFRRNRPTLI